MRPALLLLALLPASAACRGEPEPVTEPRRLSESTFQYPEELWDAGVEGTTTLRLYITEAGAVDSVHVERSSGHEAFDDAAVEGARALRFDPARQGERPVAVWRTLPVEFNLDPPAPDGAAAADPEENP